MQQQLIEFGLSFLSATGILGYLAKELVSFFRVLKKEKWASLAVKYAEETFKDLDGEEKFVKAIIWFCDHVGIKNITNEEAEGLIQSAVNELHNQVKAQ